jgi:hypothetical protein
MSDHCPICGSGESTGILRASRQPAVLNHLYATREAALEAAAVDLDFHGCEGCGFVWNVKFDRDATIYGPGYVNDQSSSRIFREHLDVIAALLRELVTARRGAVVEVGCGQGDFLRRICKQHERSGIGFDPAFNGEITDEYVTIHSETFTGSSFDELSQHPMSVVYARHVLEHISDPTSLVHAMRSLNAAMYFEVPTFDWIANQRAFYDLFNEHCSLFTRSSMRCVLKQVGIERSSRMMAMFDDQYLGVIVHRDAISECCSSPQGELDFKTISRELEIEREAWRIHIDQLCSNGPVLLWGAGAKAVSFLNHLGVNVESVRHVVDINERKHSRFLPISGQEVIAPEQIQDVCAGDRPTIIIMNPAYEYEIRKHVECLQIDASFELITKRSAPLEVHC